MASQNLSKAQERKWGSSGLSKKVSRLSEGALNSQPPTLNSALEEVLDLCLSKGFPLCTAFPGTWEFEWGIASLFSPACRVNLAFLNIRKAGSQPTTLVATLSPITTEHRYFSIMGVVSDFSKYLFGLSLFKN